MNLGKGPLSRLVSQARGLIQALKSTIQSRVQTGLDTIETRPMRIRISPETETYDLFVASQFAGYDPEQNMGADFVIEVDQAGSMIAHFEVGAGGQDLGISISMAISPDLGIETVQIQRGDDRDQAFRDLWRPLIAGAQIYPSLAQIRNVTSRNV